MKRFVLFLEKKSHKSLIFTKINVLTRQFFNPFVGGCSVNCAQINLDLFCLHILVEILRGSYSPIDFMY